jgi:hypothetical protein
MKHRRVFKVWMPKGFYPLEWIDVVGADRNGNPFGKKSHISSQGFLPARRKRTHADAVKWTIVVYGGPNQ